MARMARITRDEVAHVARLARLELSEAEVEMFTDQLDKVLDHAADVEALDVADVPPTSHALPLTNVFREDVVVPGLTPEEALSGAPEHEQQRFSVPRILGDEQ